MLRKMAFVLAATAALGAVALSPTSASAHGWGGWGGHHWGGGWGGHHWGGGWGRVGIGVGLGLVGAGIVANTCMQRQVIDTPYGPVVRWVNVCY
jgi:hypothetical protein